jgi:hypothetical protein
MTLPQMFRSKPGASKVETMDASSSSASKPASVMKARAKKARGVVMVEYAFLLVGFGVPVMIGTAAAGVSLIKGYGLMRNDMLHKGP